MGFDVVGPEDARGVGVLLHPDPRMGGTRHHPLVDDLWRRLPERGVAAVRFDFEGVDLARSAGQVVEAMAVASERWPEVPVVLVGYSFGAGIAARVDDERVAGWFLVAPQAGRLAGSPLVADERPVAMLVPVEDQFSSPDDIRAATEGWANTTLEVVDGDHFLAVSMEGIVSSCLDWVSEVVRPD